MSHFEDDDPPIKSHPASAEYRANYDTIDWGPDEPVKPKKGEPQYDVPGPIDPAILAEFDRLKAAGLITILAPDALEVHDTVFLIEGERRAIDRGKECHDCGAKPPAHCDGDIHARIQRPCNGTDADGYVCQNREGCGREGCPAADFGYTTER